MWNSIKKRIFPLIIALSALSVSASAAFYSVTGLSMLFAGASFAVIVMAASLEVAKLVIASLLYQYWDKINKLLRFYLTVAVCILILITSAGIYGYLSSAYQKTADQTTIIDSKISSLETKKKMFEETRDNILKEKQSISNLQGTLSQSSTTQYTDKKGNLVVRSNNAVIKNIESASKSNEKLSSKIDVINDSIFSLESKILEIKTTAIGESELGPLKYISTLTGIAMDRIINWFLLVIIFVFDPLAISLVIAANVAFAQLRKTPELDELNEEDKEWLEADLVKDEESKQTGIPVMVDPKTGKFYYEEPEENIYGEDEKFPLNEDNNNQKLDQFKESLEKLESITNNFNTAEYGKKMEILEEVNTLRNLITTQFPNKKDDENTITYF
jgi:hypothetical protein